MSSGPQRTALGFFLEYAILSSLLRRQGILSNYYVFQTFCESLQYHLPPASTPKAPTNLHEGPPLPATLRSHQSYPRSREMPESSAGRRLQRLVPASFPASTVSITNRTACPLHAPSAHGLSVLSASPRAAPSSTPALSYFSSGF